MKLLESRVIQHGHSCTRLTWRRALVLCAIVTATIFLIWVGISLINYRCFASEHTIHTIGDGPNAPFVLYQGRPDATGSGPGSKDTHFLTETILPPILYRYLRTDHWEYVADNFGFRVAVDNHKIIYVQFHIREYQMYEWWTWYPEKDRGDYALSGHDSSNSYYEQWSKEKVVKFKAGDPPPTSGHHVHTKEILKRLREVRLDWKAQDRIGIGLIPYIELRSREVHTDPALLRSRELRMKRILAGFRRLVSNT